MAFDGLFIHSLLQDLSPTLVGGKLTKIYQPFEQDLVLNFRKDRKNQRLLISANAQNPRFYITNDTIANPDVAPTFVMVLRKYLEGSVLQKIEQIGVERIVNFHFSNRNELGDEMQLILSVELMGRHSNVILYNADDNKIITKIKYQEKGQLVCMYDDEIHIINQETDNKILEINKNVQIVDINLKSYFLRAEEISTGLFSAKTNIVLTNIITNAETIYEVESSVRDITCYEEISAINLGTEVHFINLNGWLEKKYTSTQEIKDIVLGTSVAGIVYRDRIKIITF